MRRFAELLDRLAYEPRRNAKLRLLVDYFGSTPDPDRGWALAAMAEAISFADAKPNMVRALAAERTDPALLEMSYHFVGDLSETVALIWPARPGANRDPSLGEVIDLLTHSSKKALPGLIAGLLDALDETGRWAFLKLITKSLRIGVTARLAKTAVAMLGSREADEVELVWPGLKPPYESLFAWIEGRAERPEAEDPAPFRPVMLSHALEAPDLPGINPEDYSAEWKWDGIRIQAVGGTPRPKAGEGAPPRTMRLYSRTGEDISGAFPDLLARLDFEAAIDGELLVLREGRVQSFNVLQQRLNRKSVTPKLMAEYPVAIRAYDLLSVGGEDLRALAFTERRARLEAFLSGLDGQPVDLSPLLPFADVEALARARADPAEAGAGVDAEAVEGVMLKRRTAPYVPGRPKGQWWKWKREPFLVDAVMMYAQCGHGKRASFYSDYTFGVWAEDGTLVPVGKAYSGFTDEELVKLDRHVRNTTVKRFGPVREVAHGREEGLVLEVIFEGISRSTRHRSGVAMRFPRIQRLRWDKPPHEADRLETLLRMIDGEADPGPVERGSAAAAEPKTARALPQAVEAGKTAGKSAGKPAAGRAIDRVRVRAQRGAGQRTGKGIDPVGAEATEETA